MNTRNLSKKCSNVAGFYQAIEGQGHTIPFYLFMENVHLYLGHFFSLLLNLLFN